MKLLLELQIINRHWKPRYKGNCLKKNSVNIRCIEKNNSVTCHMQMKLEPSYLRMYVASSTAHSERKWNLEDSTWRCSVTGFCWQKIRGKVCLKEKREIKFRDYSHINITSKLRNIKSLLTHGFTKKYLNIFRHKQISTKCDFKRNKSLKITRDNDSLCVLAKLYIN